MLKKDIITASPALSGLTEEQITAIEQLSANDENAVIGTKTGELYREWDRRIEETTGVKRNGDEKSYEYLTRAVQTQSTKLTKATEDLQAIKAEKDRLAEQIKAGGGDTGLQEKYTALEAKYTTLKTDHAELKKGVGEMQTQHEQALFGVKLDNDLAIASAALKWKEGYTPSVTGVLLREAMGKMKGGAYKPEYGDDGTGNARLMFRNEAGEIVRNPETQLQPITAAELLTKELGTMGVLAEVRKQAGGGSEPGTGSGASGGKSTIDISGARTKGEADTAIRQSLAQQGLVKGTPEYQSALDTAWTDNKVAELPME